MAAPIYIEDLGEHEGKTVTVRGWLYNKRSRGHFIAVAPFL